MPGFCYKKRSIDTTFRITLFLFGPISLQKSIQELRPVSRTSTGIGVPDSTSCAWSHVLRQQIQTNVAVPPAPIACPECHVSPVCRLMIRVIMR